MEREIEGDSGVGFNIIWVGFGRCGSRARLRERWQPGGTWGGRVGLGRRRRENESGCRLALPVWVWFDFVTGGVRGFGEVGFGPVCFAGGIPLSSCPRHLSIVSRGFSQRFADFLRLPKPTARLGSARAPMGMAWDPFRFADASFLLAALRLFGEHGGFWVLQLVV